MRFFSKLIDKIKSINPITKRRYSKMGIDINKFTIKELTKREKLIKRSYKEFNKQEKLASKEFTDITGAKTGVSGLDRWKANRKREINAGLPKTVLPKSVESNEDLAKLNDFLERNLDNKITGEKMQQYRENFRSSLKDVFEDEDAKILLDKFDNIDDSTLYENIHLYEALEIHSWSATSPLAQETPYDDLFNYLNNSLDSLQ